MICDHNFYVISFIYRNIKTHNNRDTMGYHAIPDSGYIKSIFQFPFLFISFNFDNSVAYFSLLFSNQKVYGLKCILSSKFAHTKWNHCVQCVDRSESPYMHSIVRIELYHYLFGKWNERTMKRQWKRFQLVGWVKIFHSIVFLLSFLFFLLLFLLMVRVFGLPFPRFGFLPTSNFKPTIPSPFLSLLFAILFLGFNSFFIPNEQNEHINYNYIFPWQIYFAHIKFSTKSEAI